MPVMTDDQFASHNRDLLRWVLANVRMAQRIAHDAPPADDWIGCDTLRAAGTDSEDRDVRFAFEFRSGRTKTTVAKLRADYADGSVEWEMYLPNEVVEASRQAALSGNEVTP